MSGSPTLSAQFSRALSGSKAPAHSALLAQSLAEVDFPDVEESGTLNEDGEADTGAPMEEVKYEPAILPTKPDFKTRPPRPEAPGQGDFDFTADSQTKEGATYHFRGRVVIVGSSMELRADEIDYNQDSGDAEARGHVYFRHYERNEILVCARATYNTETEYGLFYEVRGYMKTKIDAHPGVLTSDNPFYFESKWAERIQEKYILHDGMITGCVLPHPWWTLTGPKFDIIPEDRALAYKAIYRLKRVPLFYFPVFYKSLAKEPRESGFLTPNLGNSSRRGFFFGLGYYWAINRSYDVTYRVQDFTERGLAHHVDFRGKPTQKSDFDFIFYGLQDKGININGVNQKQGGFSIYATGRADLGNGWLARGNVNYISSLLFRQNFTESFNEAIFSETQSTGYLTKHFNEFTFNAVLSRVENFQDATPGNYILIRKLPEAEFSGRDRQLLSGPISLWGSFDTSAGLYYRSQPAAVVPTDGGVDFEGKLQTQQLMRRATVDPTVLTAFHFLGIHLVPSFTLHESYYSEHLEKNSIVDQALTRNAREFSIDFVGPSVDRIFKKKTWFGDQLKHVVETRARYRYVTGVSDYERVLRFDESDLLTDTNEVEVSVINRVYAKRGSQVDEIFTWELSQKRFFDPTFGGALLPGERNVVLSTVELTPYTFLNGPRNYSPVVSVFRFAPRWGIGTEWRADYDPLLGRMVNSGFTADYRKAKYFVSVGHNQVHSDPALTPSANQLRTTFGYGDPNRRGLNTALTAIYDFHQALLQYASAQVNYNTDCCGISVQYRRFAFANRNENQFRVAFSVANVGSFGTLRKQDRLF